MRRFASFALLLLCGSAVAQDAKVTYSTVAVSAKKAIADLAEKTGKKLACSPAMEREVLILNLHDAPLDKVMAEIANVTSGTWTQEGDITYLSTNGSVRAGEEQKAADHLSGQIDAFLKKQQDTMAKAAKEAGDQSVNAAAAMFGMMGNSSSLMKLAFAIGAKQLAVSEGGRVVFSTNPTGMQKSLPSAAGPIIADYVTEHNKMAVMAKQDEPAKIDSDENMSALMDLFGSRMKKPQPITAPPAKALVVASRRGLFGGLTLELKLYDANGKVLASSTMPIMVDMPFDPETIGKPAPAPKTQGKDIELSPVAQELYKAGNSFGVMGGSSNLKLSAAALDAMKDPVEHDPLSFVYSEGLIAVSKDRNEQLVADLPDGMLSFFGNLTAKGKLTQDSFLKDLQGDDKGHVQEANGWLIVSPDNPVKSRKERADRFALRALIRAAQANGYASLDVLAEYATKNESPLEGAPATASYVMLFAPNAVQQSMMGMTNWDVLRLYGYLSSGQRQSLRQGARLPFSSLSPDQQKQLNKMLFGADETLMVENRGPNQPKQDPITEMIMSQVQRFGGGNETDFRTEPTEVMPSGLPSNGFISVNFTSEPIAQPQTMSTDFGRMSTVGPMELGLFKFFKEDPAMSQISGSLPTLDDLKVGTRSVYNFTFAVAPNVVQKQTLNDDTIPKDAPVYKITNLPSDFQKKIDEMAVNMKKNPIWKMVGAMGGFNKGVPPQ